MHDKHLSSLATSPSLIIFMSFDESRRELKVARACNGHLYIGCKDAHYMLYRFQNNRSSAPPIVMMDGEASEGYLLFWLNPYLISWSEWRDEDYDQKN